MNRLFRRYSTLSKIAPSFEKAEIGPPIAPFKYQDVGLRATGTTRLLAKASKNIIMSPLIGNDISGLQLSQLTPDELDELALFVANRGVVFFRDQDIKENIDEMVRIGRHFSPLLHVHQTYGILKGKPHVHVVSHTDHATNLFDNFSTSVRWHSDVTYELQPPGLTFLSVLEMPKAGGDTIWSSQYEAYNRLSKPFQKFLEGLTAIHSAKEQADMAIRTGLPLRREPVINEHPIVRTHPVTSKKALFVNPMFTRSIVGLKHEESQNILNYLYKHIAVSADFQARFKWTKNTIAVWDNRVCSHTGLVDFQLREEARLALRVTPQAERPVLLI
ncbi:hypothetical protein HDV06_000555 [Boothiomyces sp. JEL0866]|nr:hypothetical protein HDV06_000555 [Boothiomyces sp. JEL0866]